MICQQVTFNTMIQYYKVWLQSIDNKLSMRKLTLHLWVFSGTIGWQCGSGGRSNVIKCHIMLRNCV